MSKMILVVDDNASVRTLVRDYLTEEGFRVQTANNGQNALYIARREKPDLILLDIMMPEMGGYEFMRTYRKEQSTPIILLTARLEESDKVLGLNWGRMTISPSLSACVRWWRAFMRCCAGREWNRRRRKNCPWVISLSTAPHMK